MTDIIFRAKVNENGWPTRSDTQCWHPAERAISDASDAVEAMGASVGLTRAIVLLAKARNLVADYLEGEDGN